MPTGLARMVELARALAIGPEAPPARRARLRARRGRVAGARRPAATPGRQRHGRAPGRARHGAGDAHLRLHLRARLRGHHRLGHPRGDPRATRWSRPPTWGHHVRGTRPPRPALAEVHEKLGAGTTRRMSSTSGASRRRADGPPVRTWPGGPASDPPTTGRHAAAPAPRAHRPGHPRLLRPDRGAARGRSRGAGRQRLRPARAQRRGEVDAAEGHQRPDAPHRR